MVVNSNHIPLAAVPITAGTMSASPLCLHPTTAPIIPNHSSEFDVDLDIIQELEEKRRQLDDEIACFRALKEKEFQQFRIELRLRTKSRRELQSTGADIQPDLALYSSSVSASPRSGRTSHARKTSWSHLNDSISLIKTSPCPKVTAPTTAVDRTTIQRQDTPANHAQHGNPSLTVPTPNIGKTPTSTSNHDPEPADRTYLMPHPDSPSEWVSNTQPTSPVESRRHESVQSLSSSLPLEPSFSPGLQIVHTKRAYTSPLAGSRRTLPSIIRNADERKRLTAKRKHVTFQLADNAIVEPSSSYEEAASPGFDSTSSDSDSTTSHSTNGSQKGPYPSAAQPPKRTERDIFGRRKTVSNNEDPGSDEVGMGMGDILAGGHSPVETEDSQLLDGASEPHETSILQPKKEIVHDVATDGYFSPRSTSTSTSSIDGAILDEPESPFSGVDEDEYLRKRRQALASRHASKPHRLHNSPDRVRQRNPLASPPYIPLPTPITRLDDVPQRPVGSLQGRIDVNATGNIGFFELDEELASPNTVAAQPFTLDDLEDGLPETNSFKGRATATDINIIGTSVPINIVRSVSGSLNNSWREAFGD